MNMMLMAPSEEKHRAVLSASIRGFTGTLGRGDADRTIKISRTSSDDIEMRVRDVRHALGLQPDEATTAFHWCATQCIMSFKIFDDCNQDAQTYIELINTEFPVLRDVRRIMVGTESQRLQLVKKALKGSKWAKKAGLGGGTDKGDEFTFDDDALERLLQVSMVLHETVGCLHENTTFGEALKGWEPI